MTAYDAENHLIGAGWNNGAPAVDYAYDAQGKRFFMWPVGTYDSWGGNDTNYSVVMYSPSGQKLGTYLIRCATRAPTTQPASPFAARFQPATNTSAAAAWR